MHWNRWIITLLILLNMATSRAFANDNDDAFLLSPEQLLNAIVTSVSKSPEKLGDAPAAIYVLTHEDLMRSGASTIPEALRMVPGIEVAQASSNQWAITSRGFNAVFSGKLLVLIDGRSIYTSVFGGVYWDDQSVPLELIDRIEVIRGPGATMWGANAVNGVINIITKRAADTQGNHVTAGWGTNQNSIQGVHGGTTQNGFYRTYASYSHYDPTVSIASVDNIDDWYRARSGFRMDNKTSGGDDYTVQGDFFGGDQGREIVQPLPSAPFSQMARHDNHSYGANLLTHWNHKIDSNSELSLQSYVSHYSRLEEANGGQHVSSADIQLQHNIKLRERHNIIWGTGFRLDTENIDPTFRVQVADPTYSRETVNLFAQDEYALIHDILYLTLGSKFEYNDITGMSIQPSGRVAWHPTDNQTVWGAVSRAIKTPTSNQRYFNVVTSVTAGSPPTVNRTVGTSNFEDEELIAYELGHRIQPLKSLSFDSTAFLNKYDNLLTAGAAGALIPGSDGTNVRPFPRTNLGYGKAYGFEEAASWNVTDKWRLMASYSYLKMDLNVRPGTSANLNATERLSPLNQYSIRSYLNITDKLRWDNMLYYVNNLSSPINSYVRYDSTIGWQIKPNIEVSLIGQNLLDPKHPEFPQTPQAQIERSGLLQVSCRF